MGAGVVLLQALLIAIALSWVAIGWMQIHRDIRYFVSKGFSGTEYLYWFLGMTGEGNELKFFGLSIVVILLLALVIPATVAIVGFLASPSLMTPNWDYSNSWELVVTVAILAIASSLIVTLLIRKRPQDHEKLQANLTPRAARLLIISLIIDAIPVLTFFTAIAKGPFDLTAIFIAIGSGVITVSLAPLIVLIVNTLLYPFEKVFSGQQDKRYG